MTDRELLREYASTASQEAFSQIVHRYVNLVYSAARRQLGERNWAEDVVQRVFLTLAKKAGTLGEDAVLAGWLVNVTRFICLDEIKGEKRRKLREQKAAAMMETEQPGDSESDWDRIGPQLDEALETLSESNRIAVALRYLQGRSIAEVAQELSISEDAAKQRMSRGVEQLRAFFTSRGVAVPAAGLAAMLSAHALEAAPVGLAGTVATGVGTSAGIAAKGVVVAMAATKANSGVLAAVLVLLLGAGGVTVAMFVGMGDGTSSSASRGPGAIALAPSSQPLRAGETISGIIKAPDGTPLANAEVFLAHSANQVSAYANLHIGRNPGTRSAADGRFELPVPRAEPDTLIFMIRSDAGYLEITPGELQAAGGVATVQPWARVEGMVYAGDQPVANAFVNYMRWGSSYDKPERQISHNYTFRADASGKFVFDRVAPGHFWVIHRIPTRIEVRQSHHTYVGAKPGETVTIRVGGTGRPVIGRVVVNDENASVPLFLGSLYPEKPNALQPPPNWDLMSMDEKRAYERQWRQTPEGQKWMREECRNYEFPVQPDGTFRANDVLPGTYSLSLRAQSRDLVSGRAATIASINKRIVVPPINGERSDEAVDVGTVEAKLKAAAVR